MKQEQLNILLVEDDPEFARGLTSMLQEAPEAGANVSVAPDLQTGLSQLKLNGYDVVIMDFSLQDGAGLANIPLIKADAPRIPLIVVGAADSETVAVESVHAGAQDYLVKSRLTPHWLQRSVRYAIERNRSDLALHDREEQYHGIFDHLVEGIFQTTADGRYLVANAALARIYGYSTPDELRQHITDIGRKLYVQPGRREEFIRDMQLHDTITGFESQIYRKDGSMIWISENCRAIRDSQGGLLYYEGTVEDITQRREGEEKLRASEGLYHSLVETMPQCIFRKDLQGRYTFVNPQFCRVLGKRFEEVIGRTIWDFLPSEVAQERQKDDQRVFDTGKAFETIEINKFPGSGSRFIQVIKMPILDAEGRVVGLQGIFWDITEQKEAEENIRKANEELARSQRQLSAKNAQMVENMNMAREIHLALLTQQYPAFPHDAPPGRSAFQFTHRYKPTDAVGGDFFAVSALSDDEASVFICDVMGHGVRSGLVTAMIRALVLELEPLAGDPAQFLSKLNADLCAILEHTGSPMLTTAFYLVANWRTGVMRFANAGHPKPLHVKRSANKLDLLLNQSGKSQPALGLFPHPAYQTTQTTLAPGDLIMLFTDGLYEVHAPDERLYTQEMLVNGVRKRLASPASQLFDELLAEVQNFAGSQGFDDDVCLVGMEYVGWKT